MNALDKQNSVYMQLLMQDHIHGRTAVNVANALGGTVGTAGSAIPDTVFVDSIAQPSLQSLHDMPANELETLDQMNKACSDVETYLQSLDKAGVINECMNALRQCDVLEHTLAYTEKNVAQQRLFYDGMRRQLLENGHALVVDMDQTELLHYCVEILGGFVHE